MNGRIYLDHAATTPLLPAAKAAMEQGFARWANPSSPHGEGRAAKALLEEARSRIKAALGWDGAVILTSGASEALAIALGRSKAAGVLASATEHDAVLRQQVGDALAYLGVHVDATRNAKATGERVVSIHADNSAIEVWVVPTDEGRVAAQDALAFV